MIICLLMFCLYSFAADPDRNRIECFRTQSGRLNLPKSIWDKPDLLKELIASQEVFGQRKEREAKVRSLVERKIYLQYDQSQILSTSLICCSLDTVKFLMEERVGENFLLNGQNEDGQNPLHVAVQGDIDVLKYFLDFKKLYGIDQIDNTTKKRAPIHYLSRRIEGAWQKSDSYKQMTPEQACERIRLLHAYGADLNKRDKSGKSVLHWSVFNDISVMRTLLELGANPNLLDNDKCNVLNCLMKYVRRTTKTPELVQEVLAKMDLLFMYNADMHAQDAREKKSPYDRAINMARLFSKLNKIVRKFDNEHYNNSYQSDQEDECESYQDEILDRADVQRFIGYDQDFVVEVKNKKQSMINFIA